MAMSLDARERLDGLLRSKESEIVKRWTAISTKSLGGRMAAADLARQVSETYASLLSMFGGQDEVELRGKAGDLLRTNLADLSTNWVRQGFTPGETASTVFALKDALLGVWVADEGVSAEVGRDLVDFRELSRLVDQMGLHIFETYAREREEMIAEQSVQLLELSTPVIKMWDGIVAVPLIGTLDSARAQVVMETLLQALVDTGSEHAIIDITGVSAVDTQVAQHILKTVVAARLMGAECIISGIRPQIAQTVVGLGIEFGDILTKATLADALVHTLRASGVELVRRGA
ncbi:rsbT co-antagonist protein RsbR [Couchioplanes caeruleus]|uniref:Anti-anti-sigma factor n=3 Tax=Couchioplanes caeruleus TaxID=56438 RepID=A0A1K0FFM0_9ACTN|nr:STAS domain-containing protein [Couchioplanes caeruleus]OJF11633.1 anti-anti-sigma factor [Couchioplanes caeruleus subsp. caeruleus]ROP31617.1 rsbT co-antagonist protein RsbR [Couchioplanes caeruleus]